MLKSDFRNTYNFGNVAKFYIYNHSLKSLKDLLKKKFYIKTVIFAHNEVYKFQMSITQDKKCFFESFKSQSYLLYVYIIRTLTLF